MAGVEVDGLVNNAGLGSGKSVYDLTEKDFDEYDFDINCKNRLALHA